MGLNAKDKKYEGGNRVEQDPLEPGTYPVRVAQVIDLGVQEQQPYQGQVKPPVQELMVTYEFLDEFIKDEEGELDLDRPRWLSENFAFHSLDSDLAKSTKRYYALDPDLTMGGDWTLLGGFPAMATVINKPGKGKNVGKIFNNIGAISSMRKKEADKAPELKKPAKIFNQEDLDTVDIFFTLPKWLQDKIKAGLEWEGSAMAKAVAEYKKPEEGEKKEPTAKKQKPKPEPEANEEEEDW